MTLPSPQRCRALIPGPGGCSCPRQKDLEMGRLSGGTQPNYMELFWLQKTGQWFTTKTWPLFLALKVEAGATGQGTWPPLEAELGLQFTAS